MHENGAKSSLPLGIADWIGAYRAGARPEDLLTRLRAHLAQAGAPVWISVADNAVLGQRLAWLAAQAAAADGFDALLARLPLYGVPFAAKDNIDVAGFATTAACPAFAYRPAESAHAVQRLLDAGAVCMGKTNLDQFATGLVGTRSPFGAPSSVFSSLHVSGGSSSGSAVAVARGEVAFSLGTDTAGSGRVPAGFNALVGLKPTPGRVSIRGVVPACRTLDCVSIFAHTAADAAAVLATMEGPDAADPFSAFAPGPARLPAPLRIGVPAAPWFMPNASGAEYAPLFEAARGAAAALGTLRPIDFAPLDEVAALLYDGPWVAERNTVVADLRAQRPETIDPTVLAVIAKADRFDATDAFRARYRLEELRRRCARIWSEVDVLLVPTAPGHPTHVEVAADPIGANAALGRYTNFVNLLGWCALALPAGRTPSGLPFGVTLIGPGGFDAALARLGLAWTGEDAQAGPAWPACEPTLPIAVVGAHLSGLPLNGQLTERGAHLREAASTAPRYRLYALPDTQPPKPGLVRAAEGEPGSAIALEVWEMPLAAVGSFLALIPPPLGLGSIELADGRRVAGFLCEPYALAGAREVSAHGGWRNYLAAAPEAGR